MTATRPELPASATLAHPASDEHAESGPARPRARLRGLDGLRFFAAFAVLLYHFGAFDTYSDAVWGESVEEATGPVGVWFGYGALAPSLFFVISGFVILMSAQGRGWRRFVASRAARLYPAYWVAVLATSVLLLLLWNPGRAPGAGQVAVNLTMFQSAFGISHVDGVYWTLWVEMKFYLLMIIFLLIGITTRRVLIVALAWPLVSWAFALAEVPHVWDWLIYRHAPFFAGGMVIYLIHCRGHSLARWAVLAVNVALGLVHGVPGLSTQVAERTPFELNPWILGVLTLGCFASVAALSWTRLQYLNWKWLTVIGGLTYPLYLIHQYWGWWVISMLSDHVPAAVSVAAATAVAIALAWVLHKCVEVPFGPRLRTAVAALLRDRPRSRA
ncbi:acyltransferase family protein [Pseudactinotalea sp. Z1732]|uniref:acyltransferase family protein n=1 Tax=Pseudactinotalea sp. Z1732 TaxID=3413026 RepID=UPI003C7BC8AC